MSKQALSSSSFKVGKSSKIAFVQNIISSLVLMVVLASISLQSLPISDITQPVITAGFCLYALHKFVPCCHAIAGVSLTLSPVNNELLKGVSVEVVFSKSMCFIFVVSTFPLSSCGFPIFNRVATFNFPAY